MSALPRAYGLVRWPVETVGVGFPNPAIIDDAEREAAAHDAALADAQYQMVAALENNWKNPVDRHILENTEVVKTEWLADGRCQITLRLLHYALP